MSAFVADFQEMCLRNRRCATSSLAFIPIDEIITALRNVKTKKASIMKFIGHENNLLPSLRYVKILVEISRARSMISSAYEEDG